jgi:ElaB/YqjD/DUF883 family membrane-anchored ribosome-binding protein
MADNTEAVEQWGSTMRAGHEGEGVERAGTMLVELVEASRSAAEALLEEQKQRAAAQVKGFSEAVRSAAECLERSESWSLGSYANEAADQIERISQLIGQRSWNEILAETRDFARRRPWLFLGAATAAGFVAGRVLMVPAERPASPDSQLSTRGAAAEVTAAVSSGNVRLTGQHAAISAAPETH